MIPSSDQLAKEASEGLTAQAIANKHASDPRHIRRKAKKPGLELSKGAMEAAWQAKALELYRAGFSLLLIGAKCNVDRSKIAIFLKGRGLSLRGLCA